MEYVRIYIYTYRDRPTLLTSVGLAQARPNYNSNHMDSYGRFSQTGYKVLSPPWLSHESPGIARNIYLVHNAHNYMLRTVTALKRN